jgi:hypothetical protein
MKRNIKRAPKKTKKATKTTKAKPYKPVGHDSWDIYHIVIAAGLVIGFIAATHSIADLIEKLHNLNKLEESGLVAALVITIRGIANIVQRIWTFVTSVIM